ncbi:hypothetical protein LCGC14_1797060 [marine sediment metagenome]|uniref:Uncharacterized protein n=1 Tax=marine sediment metagenome TaxID=412755 RepID=A0A0F9HDF8_9ZZZZ
MDMKLWLDGNVVPLIASEEKFPPLTIHSEIHSPPVDFDLICVYLHAEKGSWPHHVRRLLTEHSFHWDYMRDLNKIVVGNETRIIFGGDGSPFLHDNGMVSCRLFKKLESIGFILEVGCIHATTLLAQADVRALYDEFKEKDEMNLQDVAVKFKPPFGEQ